MKKIISITALIIPVFILIFCSGSVSIDHKSKKVTASNKNIVVLELFTSQGCSSCPPADRLLGTYSNNENVIPLSFHVDYWNRLGWKDPFSNHLYSDRQRNYASSFGSGSVYTPQVVINGVKEMVGSEEDKIANAIKQFQKEQSSSEIVIDEIKTENSKVGLTYSVKGNSDNSVINIAVVQNKITTSIKAGENEGVTLTNYNVVRNFKTINSFSAEKNTVNIDLIPGIDKKDLSLILFLQDKNSNKIYAATKYAL